MVVFIYLLKKTELVYALLRTIIAMIRAVISGSYRRHLRLIGTVRKVFMNSGIIVLAPSSQRVGRSHRDFIFLETDRHEASADTLEREFMSKIGRADFLYVVNSDGYVGLSTSAEMSFALLHDVPVILLEGIKFFSEDVPQAVREVFERIPFRRISLTEICPEIFAEFNSEYSSTAHLSFEEKNILQSIIDRLLADLQSIS